MSFELPSTPEQISEQAVIAALKENVIYQKWLNQEETAAQFPERQHELILKDVHVREEARLLEAALMAYEDAYEQAYQMYSDDEVIMLENKIAQLTKQPYGS